MAISSACQWPDMFVVRCAARRWTSGCSFGVRCVSFSAFSRVSPILWAVSSRNSRPIGSPPYSGGRGFRSRPQDCFSWHRILQVFLRSSKQIQVQHRTKFDYSHLSCKGCDGFSLLLMCNTSRPALSTSLFTDCSVIWRHAVLSYWRHQMNSKPHAAQFLLEKLVVVQRVKKCFVALGPEGALPAAAVHSPTSRFCKAF
jgi:hypothetical protein